MTPLESKSSNNTNRVRCFGKDALVPNVVDSKWSLIKVVCTQPFNKHVQYGLSFLKVHVQETKILKEMGIEKNLVFNQLPENTKIGNDKLINVSKVKFRENSPDLENDNSTSLFSRWKKLKEIGKDQQVSAASCSNKSSVAEIQRSVNKSINPQSEKTNPIIRDRNRQDIAFGGDVESGCNQTKLEFLSQYIEKDKAKRREENEQNNKTLKKIESSQVLNMSAKKLNNIIDNEHNIQEKSNKRQSSPLQKSVKKIKNASNYTTFNQLLKGVVLVISGIQNPSRADLRNKALAMGAKYKADWDSSCTHLM